MKIKTAKFWEKTWENIFVTSDPEEFIKTDTKPTNYKEKMF